MGYYEDGKLRYAGRVGTGFTEKTLDDLTRRLAPLERETSPFDHRAEASARGRVRRARLVAEVEFREWTGERVMRAPSFKGLRDDKPAIEVVAERDAEPAEPRSAGRSAARPDQPRRKLCSTRSSACPRARSR